MPGESQGQKSLADYSPWGRKESDTTEHTHEFNKIKYTDRSLKKTEVKESQTHREENSLKTETQREDGPMTLEAETGVMYLQTTKECQRRLATPEAEEKEWNGLLHLQSLQRESSPTNTLILDF